MPALPTAVIHRLVLSTTETAVRKPSSRGPTGHASARTCAVDDEFAAWHFRDVLDQIAVLGEAVYLLEGGHRASATHLLVTYATPGYDSASDAALAGRVAAVLATDEMDLLPSAR